MIASYCWPNIKVQDGDDSLDLKEMWNHEPHISTIKYDLELDSGSLTIDVQGNDIPSLIESIDDVSRLIALQDRKPNNSGYDEKLNGYNASITLDDITRSELRLIAGRLCEEGWLNNAVLRNMRKDLVFHDRGVRA